MAIVYGDYVASLIPNTTMQEVLRDGELYNYSIQAVEGYVLHDNRIDDIETDKYSDSTVKVTPRFKSGSTTVPKSYDFDNKTSGTFTYTDENGIEVTIPVEMIGMYEFYVLNSKWVENSNLSDNWREITDTEYDEIRKSQEEFIEGVE